MATLPISPSSVSSACLCLGLKRAARAIGRRYDEAMRSLDLNNGQFAVLTSIAGLQPAGMQQLAEHLTMDRTTLTAALKPLERRRLVKVVVSKSDARAREVALTRSGSALLAKAMPVWQTLHETLAAEIGGPETDALRDRLTRIT